VGTGNTKRRSTMTERDLEIEALKERIAKLEEKAKPPAPLKFEAGPRGPTTTQIALNSLGMSPEVHAELAHAVGDETIREIVKSGGVGVLRTAVTRPTPTRVSAQNTSGWRNPQPLDVPGGARAHKLIEQGANAYLPHGPANPVGKKGEG
jgi:hypothetical protein